MSSTSQSHSITLPDGACLQVFEQGAGTPLLLISGLGGAAAFWSPCLPALTAAHRVIRLDQRGIGASTRGTAPVTIDQLADDCIAVLDHLGITSAIILGHSTGGCITQAIALRSPQHANACVLLALGQNLIGTCKSCLSCAKASCAATRWPTPYRPRFIRTSPAGSTPIGAP